MKRDRFQTAGRLAEAAELDAPLDAREEMRPITPAQRREREFHQVKAQREFGEEMAERAIVLAYSRFLFPGADYGNPTDLDACILVESDNATIDRFCGAPETTRRLTEIRDEVRRAA